MNGSSPSHAVLYYTVRYIRTTRERKESGTDVSPLPVLSSPLLSPPGWDVVAGECIVPLSGAVAWLLLSGPTHFCREVDAETTTGVDGSKLKVGQQQRWPVKAEGPARPLMRPAASSPWAVGRSSCTVPYLNGGGFARAGGEGRERMCGETDDEVLQTPHASPPVESENHTTRQKGGMDGGGDGR